MKLSGAGKRRINHGNTMQPSGNAPTQRRPSTPSTLNIILIPISIVAGIIAWFLGNTVYESLMNSIPRAFVIGIIFALLSLIIFIAVMGVSMATNAFDGNILTNASGQGSSVLMCIIGTLIVFLLASLFQWLYSIDMKKEISEPTSYIFVIDDSGSTSDTDPYQLRYKAIKDVLKGMDDTFPFMIYGFSNDTYVLREMAPISEGIPDITGYSDGGTAIKGSLEQVMADYTNKVWDGGNYPRVILLTDGYAGDIGWFSSISPTLKEYVKERISISTVGLDQVDEKLMKQIADTTGGVFISVNDANGLSEAMKNAALMVASRDLLSARYMANLNGIYGILRVVFVAVLGILIGFITAIAYGNMESSSMIIILAIIKSLIGALVMELGTGLLGMSDRTAWLILWILIALTIGTMPAKVRRETTRRPVQRPSRSANKNSRRLGGL